MNTPPSDDPRLTPERVDILQRLAGKVQKINSIFYVEDEILISSRNELHLIATLLEKYYITGNSISALVAFLPMQMVNNIHVGAGLSDKYDPNVISQYVTGKYARHLSNSVNVFLTAQIAKNYYFATVREFITTSGSNNTLKH
jgi:hypothetical protein